MIKYTDFCLYCQSYLNHQLAWKQLFKFNSISFNNICPSCEAKFQSYDLLTLGKTICSLCEKVLEQENNQSSKQKSNLCEDCFYWLRKKPNISIKHKTIYQYNDVTKDWLYQYKYKGNLYLGEIVIPELLTYAKLFSGYQWLVLPSSASSLKENHCHLVGLLLDMAKIPYICPFKYIGDGRKQIRKTREERRNLTNVFEWDSSFDWLNKMNIIIFDDLYTTGATIIQARETMIQSRKNFNLEGDVISLSLFREILS